MSITKENGQINMRCDAPDCTARLAFVTDQQEAWDEAYKASADGGLDWAREGDEDKCPAHKA